MRRFLLSFALLGLVLAAAPAQAQISFMPYAGYNLEYEEFLIGVGARFGAPLAFPVALSIQPSIETSLSDPTYVQADALLVAQLGTGSVAPYAGAGLGMIFPDVGDTELGLSVAGGVNFNTTGFIRPFVQGRYSTMLTDAFSILAGVTLGL